MANLSLKHIYKVYPNGAKAVNDFNMEIADQEFIVFVGPSGCGKSTTLRMIAGLEDISAGELKIGDTVVNDVEPKDRDIAMVFQNYALYPHMTVYENIAFGLRLRKLPKAEIHRRVLEAAEILGITEYLARKPKEMSGGQRQRVSLGRAIVREPKVMLLDEPLSNLDAKLRTQMRAEISKLHARLKTTFIYVTHDQIEAMTMGTRIVVMKNGYVQQIDTPKNLYNYPGNKFVAGFIGTPQMNFFEVTLTRKGEQILVKFCYSDAKIELPSALLCKIRPAYLDGKTRVIMGLRAEDISFDEERISSSSATFKLKISHKEELGSETLVYGDINMGGDGYVESATRVIVKVTEGETSFRAGEVVEAALDVSKIHLFDEQTELTVLPRIPEYNAVDCEIKGGELRFLGEKLPLPPALSCLDGGGELRIPCDAITFDGTLSATVSDREEVNGRTLLHLTLGGGKLFALAEAAPDDKQVKIGLDCKKITVVRDGKEVISAMPEQVAMRGKFCKEKVAFRNEKGKKVKQIAFYFQVEGAKLPVPDEVAQRLFSALGVKGALEKPLRFECSPYDIAVGSEGISAEAFSYLDYGKEGFSVCKTAGGVVYVRTDERLSDRVYLMPELDRLAIIDEKLDIRVI